MTPDSSRHLEVKWHGPALTQLEQERGVRHRVKIYARLVCIYAHVTVRSYWCVSTIHESLPLPMQDTTSSFPDAQRAAGLLWGYVMGWGLLNVDFNYKHLFPVTSQWTWREFSWIKTHVYVFFFQKCNCNIVSVFEDGDLQWSAHFLMIFSVIGLLIQSKLKYLLNLVFEGIFCAPLDSSLNSHI